MPQTTVGRGNLLYDWVVLAPALVWSSASLSSTTSELTASLPGLLPGDMIDMSLPNSALTTGLTIANARVSAANTIAVTWVAASASLTIPTGPWLFNVGRPEGGSANLPATAA